MHNPSHMLTTRHVVEINRPKEWQTVLSSELQRWSAMWCKQLVSSLHDLQSYEVEFNSKTYRVEVELLENTEKYVHVIVAVDDGSLPASISPLTKTFILEKKT